MDNFKVGDYVKFTNYDIGYNREKLIGKIISLEANDYVRLEYCNHIYWRRGFAVNKLSLVELCLNKFENE